jgi:hypothetical protein
MYANDSGSIEEVLASRRASKPPLTDEQLAIIARQHGALIDELANQELERFATEVIKNPIPIRSEPLRKLQENNLLAETPDLFYGQTGNIAPADLSVFAPPEPPQAFAADEPVVVPSGCTQMFLEPPYESGFATQEETTETTPPSPFGFKSSTRLAIPETGDLSLGVGVG